MPVRVETRRRMRRSRQMASIETGVRKAGGLGKYLKAREGPTDPSFYLSEWRRLLVQGQSASPYKAHVWVYRAARAIINSLISVDWTLYEEIGDGEKPIKTGRWAKLFKKPNPMLKGRELWELTALLYMLEGECFWVLESATGLPLDKDEVPAEIWPISGRFMKPMFDPKTKMLCGWEYRPPSTGAGVRKLKLHEVVFHRNLDPTQPGYLRGMSFLQAAMKGITLDSLATEWNEALLRNGAEPGGLLTTEQSLEENQREEMSDEWIDTHGGPRNAGKVALMEGGVKYQAISMSHKDMMYLQQLGWGREQVAAAFGVPLWFLGVSADLNFATAKSAERILWTSATLPLMKVFTGNCDADLFDGRRSMLEVGVVRGEFDTSNVEALRGDEVEKVNVAIGLATLGYPINQINDRQNLGMKPQPLGEVGLVGMGVAPRELVASGELAGGGFSLFDEEEEDEPESDEDADEAEEDGEPDEPVEEISEEPPSGPSAREIVIPAPPMHVLRRMREREAASESTLLTAEEVEQFNKQPARQRRLRWWRMMADRVFIPQTAAMFRVLKKEAFAIRKQVLRWIEQHIDVEPERSHSIEEYGEKRTTNIDPDALQNLLVRLGEQWEAAVARLTAPIYQDTAIGSLGVLEKQLNGFNTVTVGDPRIAEIIAKRQQQIKTPIQGGVKMLREFLAKGVGEGLSVDELAKLTRDRFGVVERASKIIARTEVAGASSEVRHKAMDIEGVVGREWITSGDLKVRKTHAALDGVVAEMGKPYPVPKSVKSLWTGPNLMHPLDPRGDASQVIACRCVEGPVADFD